jgi:hypothetical protein
VQTEKINNLFVCLLWFSLRLSLNHDDDDDDNDDDDDDDNDDDYSCTVLDNVTYENPKTSTSEPVRLTATQSSNVQPSYLPNPIYITLSCISTDWLDKTKEE